MNRRSPEIVSAECKCCDFTGEFPKKEVPKVCPKCKVGGSVVKREIQNLHARRRKYPQEYFENQ